VSDVVPDLSSTRGSLATGEAEAQAPAARTSLRGRLAVRLGVSVLAAGALTFGGLYALERHERTSAFDDALRDDFRTIANITQVHPGDDVYVNVEPEILTDYLAGGSKFFFVWSTDGEHLIDLSASIGDANQVKIARPTWAAGAGGDTPLDWALPDGRVVRALAKRVDAQWGLDEATLKRRQEHINDVRLDLVVARVRAPLDEALARLAWLNLLGALALPLIAVGMVRYTARRALAPLDDLSHAAAQRAPQDTAPFTPPGVRELDPIVMQLNALIGRIQQAWQRERRFLADAAHELRTPLAELHTVADVALLDDTDAQRASRALRDTRQVAQRMERLVGALFKLARQDRLRDALQIEPVALLDVAEDLAQAHARAAQARGLQWRVCGHATAACADPGLLRALLDNLATNAVAYADDGSPLVVQILSTPAPAIVLSNEASALSAVDVQRLFEPFWRAGGHHDDHHAGLGLALARAYAQAMNLALDAQLQGTQLRMVVAWPVVQP
jgi:signal transduction histidine kinase